MYYRGKGVRQDYAEAMWWYRLAAEKGDAEAQCNLGDMYYRGEGVPKDYFLPYLWFELCAVNSENFPERYRGIEGRGLAAEKLTQEQIAEAQQMAREWKAID
jgi:TPR repeat protein